MSTQSAPIIEKLVAGLALAFALLVLASLFTPSHSAADSHQGASHNPESSHSTDPHEGLPSMGSFEGKHYVIEAYATETGPRYSIYDSTTHEELAVLITAQRVEDWYPEANLSEIQFDAPGAIMLANPEGEQIRH
jgi:hypothetical protein